MFLHSITPTVTMMCLMIDTLQLGILLVRVVLVIVDGDDMFVCPVTPEVVINF